MVIVKLRRLDVSSSKTCIFPRTCLKVLRSAIIEIFTQVPVWRQKWYLKNDKEKGIIPRQSFIIWIVNYSNSMSHPYEWSCSTKKSWRNVQCNGIRVNICSYVENVNWGCNNEWRFSLKVRKQYWRVNTCHGTGNALNGFMWI